MSRFHLSFIALLLLIFDLSAQDSARVIFLEAGIHVMGCQSVEKDYLRAENLPATHYSPDIASRLSTMFAGAKLERRIADGRLGLLPGLRITRLESSLTKLTAPEYFFFLHRQTPTTTEYLRVTELREVSFYAGVPFEFRWYFPRDKAVTWYLMAAAEWNWQLRTKIDAQFYDPAMAVYEDDVREIIGDSNHWFASFCIGAGLIFGRENPRIMLALSIPAAITESVSSLNVPISGGGLHVLYKLPLKRNL